MSLKKTQKCYLTLDDEQIRFSAGYHENLGKYRLFFMHGDFSSKEFHKICLGTRKSIIKIQIDQEDIPVVVIKKVFLNTIPGQYFVCLHLQEYKKDQEVYWAPLDVTLNSEFFCEIGKIIANISITIEPAPHNNPDHAHFHTVVMCPKVRIVESPEPDRCSVTELPCPFWQPVGKRFVDKLSRQREYGLRILQYGAYFEYYATQKLINYLKEKGVDLNEKRLPQMPLGEKIRLLYSMNIINNTTYSKIVEVKKERDKLAHEAKPFHALYDLEDKRAMEIIRKAEECLNILHS